MVCHSTGRPIARPIAVATSWPGAVTPGSANRPGTSRAIDRSTAIATSAVATHGTGTSPGSGYATTPLRTVDHAALRFSR